ncbi:PAS domain S-box protein [Candidatus Synechococcus calcipolaris G9]|uniref:PAS domain S-box protein n=1 Tax=Candidatus Synechococcus calcipolaris G9 TaxID=1497997 RepID=A0ABT6F397_9SYNE|nr:PAS domain S-box protein [Candidatus Synechococcus calcipolaris]MDG2992346.1 PAS domain S-box protein [Candidatus Synechococcus calcipolaris G9]
MTPAYPPLSIDQISLDDWECTPESVKQLLQFLDATPIGISVHDPSGKLIYLNQVGRSLLGVEHISVVETAELSFRFQAYRGGTGQLYPTEELPVIQALRGETVWADDMEIHQQGKVICLETWASPIFNVQGQVIYGVVAFQDISDRKRREIEQQQVDQQVRAQDIFYREVIQAQTDMILRSQADTTITFANEAFCLALGRPLEEVIGLKWFDFVPVDQMELVQERLVKLSPDHPTFESINQDYRPNQEIGWTHWISMGVFNEQGQLLEIQSVGRDITALQRKVEREQALNRVIQAIRQTLDLETIFTTATRETAQLLTSVDCFVVQYFVHQSYWEHVAEFYQDTDHASTLGLRIPDQGKPFAAQLKNLQIVQVEDTRAIEDAINQAIAQDLPGAWLLVPLVVNGSLWGSFTLHTDQHAYFWTETAISLARAVAEQLELAIHQAQLYQQAQLELAQRRQVEQALRESQNRLQNMAENLPGALFRYIQHADGSNRVIYMSRGCVELWEVEADVAEQDSSVIWQLTHPDDLPGMYASVMESARTLTAWFWSWRIITPSGQLKWLEGTGRPEQQANGDVVWDSLIIDITARKQAELQFQNLVANAPGVIYQYVLHPDGRDAMVYISEGCRDLWGLEPEAIRNDLNILWALTYPDDTEPMRQSIAQSAKNLTPWVWEWRMYHCSGTLKWLRGSSNPQQQANGDVVWDGLILDISDRKEVEAKVTEQQAQLDLVIQSSNVGFYITDLRNQTSYVSPSYKAQLGYGEADAEAAPSDWNNRLHPDDRDRAIAAYQALLRKDAGYSIDFRLRHRDGSYRWIYSNAQLICDDQGQPIKVVGSHIDISDRKEAEAALRESEERYRFLAENINDLIALHHPDGTYIYVSPSCETLLGYRCEEMMGRDPYSFLHPEDRDRIQATLEAALNTGKFMPITYRVQQKTGNYLWFETLIKPIFDRATGVISQLQTTSRNVTQRVEVQDQLKHDALHDALTGLPNRNLLMERLELALNRAKRFKDHYFAVLFLDLDRFKVINDSLGHLAGDQLLIRVAQKLDGLLRAADLVVRLGGDEFVILLEEIKGIEEAVRVAERILAELHIPIHIGGREVYTTASIGIVFGSDRYTLATNLLRDADIAMYRAKNTGKSRYEIFDAEMHRQALRRLHLENDLRQALDRQELVLHYQPIVTLDTCQLVGFEALIRWQHPSQGLKYPDEFMAIAEETGLITPMDIWGLRTACQQLRTWQQDFPDHRHLKVSVNLSAQDLRRGDILYHIDLTLAETQLPSHCLTLEITESMLIDDIESTIALLEAIKERGIYLSIDDFGTGYSSLSYLHRLPVDNLKVDRSFVNQMNTGRRNHQIVETIVTLSNQLELDAIAEGIETEEQRQQLQDLGYKFGQGYLFSKSLNAQQVKTLLAMDLGNCR